MTPLHPGVVVCVLEGHQRGGEWPHYIPAWWCACWRATSEEVNGPTTSRRDRQGVPRSTPKPQNPKNPKTLKPQNPKT